MANFDARLFGKLWGAPIEGGCTLSEGAQCVQLRHGLRQFGERLNVSLQSVEQELVQIFFSGKGALLGRQSFVFKGFELRRDEALGIFQSLTPTVIVGYFVNLTLCHFDVETVHFVELNTQIGNASARFFAGFQFEQKIIAVGLNGAQLIELSVQTMRHHAAITDQIGRLF